MSCRIANDGSDGISSCKAKTSFFHFLPDIYKCDTNYLPILLAALKINRVALVVVNVDEGKRGMVADEDVECDED